MIYTRTETHQGSDGLITKDAHIVAISADGDIIGYVATCSTIYRGCWGFNGSSQSFVYDKKHLEEAKEWCDNKVKGVE